MIMMKRNRTLIMMLCAAVCILALCGCSKAEEVKSMFDPGSKLDIEYGMTVLDADSQDETIGIVVTNNNDKAASSVMLKLTPYDAEGNVMTYSEGGSEAGSSAEILLEISYIMPGEKAGLVVDDIPDLERSPDHVDVTVDDCKWLDESKVPEGDVAITDFVFNAEENSAVVSLKNTTDFTYDLNDLLGVYTLSVGVIGYDAEGRIVGGDSSAIEYLGPDSEITEELYFGGKLDRTEAVTYEPYVKRDDFIPDPATKYYDSNGKEYTAKEVEEYLENRDKAK